ASQRSIQAAASARSSCGCAASQSGPGTASPFPLTPKAARRGCWHPGLGRSAPDGASHQPAAATCVQCQQDDDPGQDPDTVGKPQRDEPAAAARTTATAARWTASVATPASAR